VRGHEQDAPQLAEPAKLLQRFLGPNRLHGAAAGDRPGQKGPSEEEWSEPSGGPFRPAGAS
jgi:hypothetical protein